MIRAYEVKFWSIVEKNRYSGRSLVEDCINEV